MTGSRSRWADSSRGPFLTRASRAAGPRQFLQALPRPDRPRAAMRTERCSNVLGALMSFLSRRHRALSSEYPASRSCLVTSGTLPRPGTGGPDRDEIRGFEPVLAPRRCATLAGKNRPPSNSGPMPGMPHRNASPKQFGNLATGRLGVVGRECDGVSRSAGLEQDLYGFEPVCEGIVLGSLAASDRGPVQGGAVPGGVVPFDVGAAVEEKPDRGRASGVGGDVEGGAAQSPPRISSGKPSSSISATAPRRRPRPHGRSLRARLRSVRCEESWSLLFTALATRGRPRQAERNSSPPVAVRWRRGGAAVRPARPACGGREFSGVRPSGPARSGLPVGEEQFEELGAAAGPDRGTRRPGWSAVVVAVTPRVGARPEKQPSPSVSRLLIGAASACSATSLTFGGGRGVPQQLVAVLGEAGEVEVMVVGDRAAFEQQFDDGLIAGPAVRARNHAAKRHHPRGALRPGRRRRRAAAARLPPGRAARAGSNWCQREANTPRGGAPAGARVGTRREARSRRSSAPTRTASPRTTAVAKWSRQFWVAFEHPGGAAATSPDARRAERVGLLGEVERVGASALRLQSRPAREPVLACERQLGRTQR